MALSTQGPFADERAETLCRRIELYRGYLQKGVDAALAADYLREYSQWGGVSRLSAAVKGSAEGRLHQRICVTTRASPPEEWQ
jgi:hypothetical protein